MPMQQRHDKPLRYADIFRGCNRHQQASVKIVNSRNLIARNDPAGECVDDVVHCTHKCIGVMLISLV